MIDVNETIAQLGGRGLYGALVYTGTRRVAYNDDHVYLTVNGKRSETWWIVIKLELNDTYTVSLRRFRKDWDKPKVSHEQDNVYCDELQGIVESIYDTAIKGLNGGFIPLARG